MTSTTSTGSGTPEPTSADGWAAALSALRTAGTGAGRAAADWWAQDTIGGRATGDVKVTARQVLAGIDDEDPALLDTLPTPAADPAAQAALYREHASGDAAGWDTLSGEEQQQAVDAYRDAFTAAVTERVAELCRRVTSPTGDGRDLSYLHPDRLRIGSVGVFAGDWAGYSADDGAWRIAEGYVGRFVDTWNGWAVFRCTRPVAEAIVAEQARTRAEYRRSLIDGGMSVADADARVNAELAILTFDGDEIVADERLVQDDPEAIERSGPDDAGRYVVMGYCWCWTAVDPNHCDRLVGELPPADRAQEFVLLPHTWLRVPHDRLRVTALRQMPTPNGVAYTATVCLDDVEVGQIVHHGNGGGPEPYLAHPRFGWRELAGYVAASSRYGEPASEEQVLDALVTEFDLAQIVGRARAAGGAVVRLRDDAGNTLDVQTVHPAPTGLAARQALARNLAATAVHRAGRRWEIWSGTAWRHLGPAIPATPEPR